MQEGVLLGHLACDGLWTALAIANRREAVFRNAVGNEVVYHAFCAALAQFLVIFVLTTEVAVAGEFDGDVGIFVQQGDEAVQRLGAVGSQLSAVKLVEHVAYQHGSVDVGQGELQHIFLAFAGGVHAQLFLMVQITFAGAQEDVFHVGLYLLCEAAVALYAKLEIGAVVAHHIDQSLGQFVSVLFIDPSLDGLDDLGTVE